MTYSILGYDASNGDLGVAVQSKFPGVGSLVPMAKPRSASSRRRGSETPDTGRAA
jgi:uncharacterized Ntn-hydrolase superfamily protein